jgi:hypothetical protein
LEAEAVMQSMKRSGRLGWRVWWRLMIDLVWFDDQIIGFHCRLTRRGPELLVSCLKMIEVQVNVRKSDCQSSMRRDVWVQSERNFTRETSRRRRRVLLLEGAHDFGSSERFQMRFWQTVSCITFGTLHYRRFFFPPWTVPTRRHR